MHKRRLIGLMLVIALAASLLQETPTAAIIHGSTAPITAYPARDVVRILIPDAQKGEELYHTCSGTLISRRVVLTANHCHGPELTQNVKEWLVLIGESLTQAEHLGGYSTYEGGTCGAREPQPYLPVDAAVAPTGYEAAPGGADMLLLFLPTPTRGLSDRGAPVPVATSADSALWATNASVTMYGWGRTLQGTTPTDICSVARTLQKGVFTVKSKNPGQISTTSRTNGALFCHGDSGGPLIAGDKLIGENVLVSNGYTCTGPYYSVSTDGTAIQNFLVTAISSHPSVFPYKVLPNAGGLYPGDVVSSTGNAFQIVMQPDGNLVIYKVGGHVAVWASNTNGNPGAWADMQGDGNLVVYKAGQNPVPGASLCSIGTHPGVVDFEMGPGGNLVVYGPSRQVLWTSQSGHCT